MPSFGRGGAAGAVVATVFTALGLVKDDFAPPDVVRVNRNDELLEDWQSDDDENAEPNCRWFDGTVVYESSLCNHFVLSRSSSSPAIAFHRARRCAAKFQSECVLSPEVGLAIPAAFVAVGQDLQMLIGPRFFQLDSEQKLTRVTDPGSALNTRTESFNKTIDVEYLDGFTRRPRRERLEPPASFCVQLLRQAFTAECWENLD